MRCTLRRCGLAAPALAIGALIFTLCLLRGRAPPSPRIQAAHKAVLATVDTELQRRHGNTSTLTARKAAEELLQSAARRNRSLHVLQVGACDGEWGDTNDPVQPLLVDPRVKALLLEPVPPTFELLRKNVMALPQAKSRLLALNAALCPAGGAKSLPFYKVSERYAIDHPEAPHWAKREIGSLMRAHVEKHKIPAEYIEEIPVPCRTAAQVFQEAGSPLKQPRDLDVLLVDAEGMDAEVVNAFLELPGFRPPLIIYEKQHMPAVTRKLLAQRLQIRGYNVSNDHRNSIAVLNIVDIAPSEMTEVA